MQSLLSTISLPDFVDLVRRDFATNVQMVKPVVSQLFIVDQIGKGMGNSKLYEEYDVQTYARNKKEGQAVAKASVGTGYSKTLYKKRVGIEVDITQEMRDENRYSEVGAQITNLSQFCPQREELDGTHIFTFAGATSYVDMDGDTVNIATGDGLSLINTAHTLKFSTATYSNEVSGDPVFSETALEAAELLAVTNIVSNYNERRVIDFRTIVTSDYPVVCNNVARLLKSTAYVAANYSAGVENVYMNKYTHLVLPQLATTAQGVYNSAKKNYWFFVANGQGTNGWQAYKGIFEAPHLKTPGFDHYSRDIWSFGTRSGYGYASVTGRGIIGSLNAS